MDELDEEANEAHDQEPHAGGIRYPGKLWCGMVVECVGEFVDGLSELGGWVGVGFGDEALTFAVGLGALLDQVGRVLGELLQGLDDVGVHVRHGWTGVEAGCAWVGVG